MNIENSLILDICSFQDLEKKSIETKLEQCGNTSSVLGKLLLHRMGGVAYDTLRQCELLGKVNREFRTALYSIYKANCLKSESFNHYLKFLADCLKDVSVQYAALKGAYLSEKYPKGYRTSNDIDLLLHYDSIYEIDRCLKSAGFKQGYIRNGTFIEASRLEIIGSCMNRGETVPYILKVDAPFLEFLEVDINFSLDYKPSDGTIVSNMLCKYMTTNSGLHTLSKEDFFIHLCAHLYKEATTYAWIEMGRDLSLYKFADIYLLANEYTKEDYNIIEKRIKELGMEKECAYSMLGALLLFPITDENFIRISENLYEGNDDCLNKVIDPVHRKEYQYTTDFLTRFFDENRKKYLQEVDTIEKTTYV